MSELTDHQLLFDTAVSGSTPNAASIQALLNDQVSDYIDNTISFAFVLNNSSTYDYIAQSQSNEINNYDANLSNIQQANMSLTDKTTGLALQQLMSETATKAFITGAIAASLIALILLLDEVWEGSAAFYVIYSLIGVTIIIAAIIIGMMYVTVNSYVRRDMTKLYWTRPADIV